ncbi:MAG: hypothetical protein LBT87_01000 [Treponema sp.]|jgi:hypothetical protein|nr:hypothetical protein [Treponema sp.]
MNIDTLLANRILLDIGDEILTEGDVEQDTLRWRILKEYYLATVINAISSIPWTNGKRRIALEKIDTVFSSEVNPENKIVNHSPYRYMYKLPADCARPLEIQGDYFYVIENGNLLTDRENAALLYVSNGRLEKNLFDFLFGTITLSSSTVDFANIFSVELPGDIHTALYVVASTAVTGGTTVKVTVKGATTSNATNWTEIASAEFTPAQINEGRQKIDLFSVRYPFIKVSIAKTGTFTAGVLNAYLKDDYPGYCVSQMEPIFYEYVEKLIASKMVTKLTPSRAELRQTLFAEAMLSRQEALSSIRAVSSSRMNGERRWDEELQNARQDLYLQQAARNGGQ